jgi:hypothetical protein
MKIHEISEAILQKFPQSWEQKLRATGYRLLGRGRYAHVWAKPGDPFVVKVFQYDPAYADFIELISQHQDNPHFPRIKGRLVRLDEIWQAIRIERLTRLPPPAMVEQILEYRGAHNFLRYSPRPDTLPSYIEETNRFYQTFRQQQPQLSAALDLIFSSLCDTGKCGIDLATRGNIRMRGNVVVVTDPVFDTGLRT